MVSFILIQFIGYCFPLLFLNHLHLSKNSLGKGIRISFFTITLPLNRVFFEGFMNNPKLSAFSISIPLLFDNPPVHQRYPCRNQKATTILKTIAALVKCRCTYRLRRLNLK